MNKLKCSTCGKLTAGTILHVPVGDHIDLKGLDVSIDIHTEDSGNALCKRCIIDAIKRLDGREEDECHCEDQYTVEPHGDKFAVYFGRCQHRHGQRILSFMPDGSDVSEIEARTGETPEWAVPEIEGLQKIIGEMGDAIGKKEAEISSLKKQLEAHKDAIHFHKEASRIRNEMAKDPLKVVRSMGNTENGNSSEEAGPGVKYSRLFLKREAEYYKELSKYYLARYHDFIDTHDKFIDRMSLMTGIIFKKIRESEGAAACQMHDRELTGDLSRAINSDAPSVNESRSGSTSEWSSGGHGNDDDDVVNR